jgi:hypothetical protein
LGLAAVTKDTSPLSLIYKKMAAEEAYGPMGYTYLGNGQFVPHDQAPAGESSSSDCGTQNLPDVVDIIFQLPKVNTVPSTKVIRC